MRKSESRETTFPQDVTDRQVLRETVDRLARSVCESLAENSRRGRTVTLKIRLRPFKTYTRSRTLPAHTVEPDTVAATALELLERFDPQRPVRLVGVGLAGLAEEEATHQPGQLEPTSNGLLFG